MGNAHTVPEAAISLADASVSEETGRMLVADCSAMLSTPRASRHQVPVTATSIQN